MGTRNLIVVVSNKKPKVAQYCQWDGYLEGQGKGIVNFIENKMDLKKFKKAVNECVYIDDKEFDAKAKECGANNGSFDMKAWDNWARTYPELCRDTGSGILELIQDKGARKLRNSLDFGADSLFCEWAYVIDLDKKVLEIYKGCNRGPVNGRFKKMKCKDEYSAKSGYNSVTLFKKLPFSKCTKSELNKIIKKYNKEDEE